MEVIDYSIVIRTTGHANEKYQRLLDSIKKLEPKPIEIIVVLPEGNDIPEEQIGVEKYYFCKKGMVLQRMTGIAKCKTKYALVCDDDIEFKKDFVQKLYQPIKEGKCSLSAGPLYSFLPPKGFNAVLSAIMSSAVPTVFHKDRYISILRSSGYSYNRHLKEHEYYESQSVAWTCFFCDVDAVKRINLNDETWLDSHGYSSLDDQTMFYKGWLLNIKTMVVSDAYYTHLDARTSIRNNKKHVLFSISYNRVVFWHRFILKQQCNVFMRFISRLCFWHRSLWMFLYDLLDILRNKITIKDFKIKIDGYFEAWKYIKSAEYINLPPIC